MNNLLVIFVLIIYMILGAVVFAFSEAPEHRPSPSQVFDSIVTNELDKRIQSKVDAKSRETTKAYAEKFVRSFIWSGDHTERAELRIEQVPSDLAPAPGVIAGIQSFQFNGKLRMVQEPEPPISVTIKPTNNIQESGSRSIDISIENTSDEPVKILKPLDGSFWGWFPNHYKFTALDSDGEPLGLGGRCGVCGAGGMAWPNDFVVELDPTETFEVTGYLPQAISREITPEDIFKVSFEYIYIFGEDESRKWQDGYSEPVEGVWQGVAKSNTLEMTLRAKPDK